MDWSTWLQGIGTSVIGAAADAKYRQPYEIQKLQLQQLGQLGPYTEGQPMGGGAMGGINPAWLLIGGALLVAVLIIKD